MAETGGKRAFGVEVKLTDRCNQACSHCANSDGPSLGRDLDVGLFNRKLQEWAGDRAESGFELREVRMTGGEPLTRLDAVLAVAAVCRNLGIRSGINTNGLLLDTDGIQRLKESGVEVVKISLDAMEEEAYARLRGPLSSFRSFLARIEELIRNRFKVILRFTLMRENRGSLRPCWSLAEDLGVHKFQIKPLIRSGRAKDPGAFLDSYEIDASLRDLADSGAGTGTPVEVLCWPEVAGARFSFKNCGSSDKIYVSCDLAVSICNFIENHARSAVGDLTNDSLQKILEARFDGSRTQSFGAFSVVKGCPNFPQFERARG